MQAAAAPADPAIARGFPRLLGDADVRWPPRITRHPFWPAYRGQKGLAGDLRCGDEDCDDDDDGAVAYALAGAIAQVRRPGIRGVADKAVLTRVRRGEREEEGGGQRRCLKGSRWEWR